MTVRASRGPSQGQLFVMSRIGGRDTGRVCDLAELLGVHLRRAAGAGQFQAELELPGQPAIHDPQLRTHKAFVLTLGGTTLRGEGTTKMPEGVPPSTTSAIGFWGAMVAIVLIFGIVALAGIISGNPMRSR